MPDAIPSAAAAAPAAGAPATPAAGADAAPAASAANAGAGAPAVGAPPAAAGAPAPGAVLTGSAAGAAPAAGADGTPAANPPAAAAPAPLALTLPENAVIKQADVDAVAAFAQKHGLNQDAAQALLADRNAFVQSAIAAEQAATAKQAETWHQQIQSDPTFGGEQFAATAQRANGVLAEFTKAHPTHGQAFLAELKASPYVNHPGLVALLGWVGSQFGQAQQTPGGSGGGGGLSDEQAALRAEYPSMFTN